MMFRTKYNGFYYLIYKTTNLVNGKIYVGQHKTDDLNDGYIGDGICNQVDVTANSCFHNAVRKYKYENFKSEIIEYCRNNRDLLDEREIFWIKELGAHISLGKGYNMTWGGGGGDTFKFHPDYDGIIERMKIQRKGQGIGHVVLEETRQKIRKTQSEKPILTCPFCGLQSKSDSNMKTYHFDNCKKNPNYIPRKKKLDMRELKICEWCDYQGKNNSVLSQFHGDNCRKKPGNENKVYFIRSKEWRENMSVALTGRIIPREIVEKTRLKK